MGFSIKYVYEAIDKFTPTIDKIQTAALGLKYKMDAAAESMEKIGEKFEKVGEKVSKVGEKLDLFVSLPMAFLGEKAIESAEKIDTFRASLELMLQSTGRAKELSDALTHGVLNFQMGTPFSDNQLLDFTRQILALGGKKLLSQPGPKMNQDIISRLRMIGDISAGSSNGRNFDEIAGIYTSVAARHKVMPMQLAQLEKQGIPIVEALQSVLKVSDDKMKDLMRKTSHQGIASDAQFEKALERITTKGGMFYKATERMDETIEGSITRFKNTLTKDLGFGALGESDRTGLPTFINKLTFAMDKMFKTMQGFSAGTQDKIWKGLFGLMLLGPAITILGKFIQAFGFLIKLMPLLLVPLRALTLIVVGLGAPLATALAAITAIGLALWYAHNHADQFAASMKALDTMKFSDMSLGQKMGYLAGKALEKTGNAMHYVEDRSTNRYLNAKAVDDWKQQAVQAHIAVDINNQGQARVSSVRTNGLPTKVAVGNNMPLAAGAWAGMGFGF